MMRVGILLPQNAVRTGAEVRRFAEVVEGAGLSYVAAYDHVLGADVRTRTEWTGPYTAADPFHAVLVLFGYLSAVCTLDLVTGVLVLPQLQTPLVAKQVAELEQLAPGRIRLGVGVGWNAVEFAAMDSAFHTRGDRLEEQIEVLRLLWTTESVTFEGRFHQLDRVGINPLPPRPIPLWLGGAGRRFTASVNPDRVLDRIGRIADGWIAGTAPEGQLAACWQAITASASRAGRDPDQIGFQAAAEVGPGDGAGDLPRRLEQLAAIGATHVTLITPRRDASLDAHLGLVSTLPALLASADVDTGA